MSLCPLHQSSPQHQVLFFFFFQPRRRISAPHPYLHLVFSVFKFSHSKNVYVIESHCTFNSYLSNDWYSHVLRGHAWVSRGASLPIFSHFFLNRVILLLSCVDVALYQIRILQIPPPPPVTCLFVFLAVSFEKTQLKLLIMSILFFFTRFMAHSFCILRCLCPPQRFSLLCSVFLQ